MDALLHEHNHHRSDVPHWNETVAARHETRELATQGRMHVFLDLHDPATNDPSFFFRVSAESLTPDLHANLGMFVDLAQAKVGELLRRVPISNNPEFTGLPSALQTD